MKQTLVTDVGSVGLASALALALALAAPSATAGFILDDYILLPVISAAEVIPPPPSTDIAYAPVASAQQQDEQIPEDAAMIRISGAFCKVSTVYQGTTGGGFAKLLLESSDNKEIVAALAEYEPGITYKFGVTCLQNWYWHVATIDVTIPPKPEQSNPEP